MKITPTLGGEYSGSFGGLTASHNAGGTYFRRRSVPTNPNTGRQQAIRAAMGSVVQYWSDTLSLGNQQSWRNYAENTPVNDTLGQAITLSGVNMFARTNVPILQIDAATGSAVGIQEAAPVVFNTGSPVGQVTTFEGDFTAPPGTVGLTGTIPGLAPDDGRLLVFIAPPQTSGTRFYKGPYQFAAEAAVTASDGVFATGSIDIATDWHSDTVPVPAWDGLFVPVRLRILYDDGRLSEEFRELVQFTDATP